MLGPMSARLSQVLLALVAASAAAGCFGAQSGLGDPRTVIAEGSARVSEAGWAYDGADLHEVPARFEGSFNDAENSGSAVITVSMPGEPAMRIEFDSFAEAAGKGFMDGGIAFDLVEHGDSGTADASVPRILALVAAWGEARLLIGGEPVLDPATGAASWSAHVMASDTTVRGADGKIATADGSAPYDPAAPADARRVEGDRQLLFSLKPHPRATPPAPFNASEDVTVSGPADEKSFPVPAEFGARVRVSVSTSGLAGPLPAGAGNLEVRLVSPSGTEVASQSTQVTPASVPGSVELEWNAVEAGEHQVVVTAQGAFSYSVTMSTEYGSDRFFTFTWDDFSIE